MQVRRTLTNNKVIVSGVILITTVFLLPLVVGGFSDHSISKLFSNESSGFSASLARTVLFAVLSATTNVLGGLCLALLLAKISIRSKLGRQLSFFMLPVILGNITAVFVFKMLLSDTALFNSIVSGGNTTQTIFLLLIQFWQFGFLFAYLFWLNLQNIPMQIEDYSVAVGLSKFEKIRDVTLPHIKNLFILLFFISLIFSFYEDAKSQFIFRASQGAETELISHWLYRTYQSNLLIDPVYASQALFKTGVLTFSLTALLFFVFGSLILLVFRLFSKIKGPQRKVAIKGKGKISFTIAAISIAAALLPVLIVLIKSNYHLVDHIFSITFPFVLTLIAAFMATIFAISFSIASRLAFTKILSGFNSKSLLYFLLIFLLQIIPPLCIILCGFKWLSWVGYSSDILIYIVWIFAHCILTLPLLGSFLTVAHFSVKENELNYLTAYQISGRAIVGFSFVKRFKVEYILTLLFAFTFIWNDTGLNMVLSDQIPSFAANLQMLFIGRAADYSKAASFVLVAVALALACILIWQWIIVKRVKLNGINEDTEI